MTAPRPATRVIAEWYEGKWSFSLRDEDNSIRMLMGSRGQRRSWRQLSLALHYLQSRYVVSSLQLRWHPLR